MDMMFCGNRCVYATNITGTNNVDKRGKVICIKHEGWLFRMTDFEMIVKEFCIPTESEFICDELCGWDIDKEDESWCSRNCGVTNCGKYPEMNCYKEWVKMKRSDEG